jgi:hypothetical protein
MQVQTSSFAPDSVYATYTPKQVAICDRMEAEFNSQQRTQRARNDEHAYHPVHRGTDDSLRRSAKRIRRQLEDIADGELNDNKSGSRRRMLEAQLRDIETEQEVREALAETWQAAERGTECYTAFKGRGGLEAVVNHGATPPSYELAKLMDWEHFKTGRVYVLAWEESK